MMLISRSQKTIHLINILSVSIPILFLLVLSDYLPMHDIYKDYVSPFVLSELEVKFLTPLPAWTNTPLEWNWITFNYVLKVVLSLVNIIMVFILKYHKTENK